MTNKHEELANNLTMEDIVSSVKFLNLMCDWIECDKETCEKCTICTMKKTLELLRFRKIIGDMEGCLHD